jgi:hypothetical protein
LRELPCKRLYDAGVNCGHIVSGLSFGFWVQLLSKKYEGVFWPRYLSDCFPNKPSNVTRQNIYDQAEMLRVFRNRMAHYKPIHDRNPKVEFQNMIAMVSWVSAEASWFLTQTARVDETLGAKPTY